MRKYIKILPLMLFMLLCLPLTAVAAVPVNLAVNGETVLSDSSAYSENGRTMVPIRFVMDELGATVNWDNETQTATIYKGSITLELRPDSRAAVVNGITSQMDAAATVQQGRIFVPVRFVAELFNATVNWNGENNCVEIWFAADSGFTVTGYYYDADSYTCYSDYYHQFDSVAHFNYSLTEDGHISARRLVNPDRYEELAQSMQYYGQEKLMLVTGFYSYIVDAVVTSPEMRASVIADILAQMEEGGYDGVDLDIEAMSDSSRDYLVLFVQELKTAMGADKTLTMSLTPRVADRQYWLAKYDYASLAAICDRIHLMFYNQHYSGSSPGANCGIDWLQQGIEYMLQYIPREKMVIGLGGYGYDWTVSEEGTRGSSVRIATALERAAAYGAEILRDEASGVPYFTYYKLVEKEIEVLDEGYMTVEREVTLTDEFGNEYTQMQTVTVPASHTETVQVYEQHEVWFEDAQSMAQKVALVRGYRVQGIALWRMGFIPNDVLDAIFWQCK